MKNILGISAFYHDSAAALIVNGKIIAAAQEERFSRIKHDPSYPKFSIDYILKEGKLKFSEIDAVVFYDKPFLKFERLLETYIGFIPFGLKSFRMAMPIWLREKLFLKDLLIKIFKENNENFNENKLFFSEHHLSHAASAFYPSPFKDAIILTLDGVGEWATTTIGIGNSEKLKIEKELHFPHSLGLLYSAFTYYTGFKVNSGEYKLMGLAPYGEPRYSDIILKQLIDLKDDGSYRLNQKYFNYSTGLTMVNKNFEELFGNPIRNPEIDDLTQFHMDIAASIQNVIELIVIKIAKFAKKNYGYSNLCLAGGVALNCVANGKIFKEKIFKNIWIQPASGDAGGALGAALAFWHLELNKKRTIENPDSMNGSYLGPKLSDDQIENELTSSKAIYKKLKYEEIIERTAVAISNEKAVGWIQGKMEFGPRALGNRSILADPRSKNIQKQLNLKIKFRESFRPFAPSVLEEDVNNWFDFDGSSPYMLIVSNVKKNICNPMTEKEKKLFGIEKLNISRSKIPAITHVDYSARIQTVHKNTNKKYYDLIKKFYDLTGCPILVNTSFNIRGEPIVCSPKDAFRCFMGTNLDFLVIGNYILDKRDQHVSNITNYKDQFELD